MDHTWVYAFVFGRKLQSSAIKTQNIKGKFEICFLNRFLAEMEPLCVLDMEIVFFFFLKQKYYIWGEKTAFISSNACPSTPIFS